MNIDDHLNINRGSKSSKFILSSIYIERMATIPTYLLSLNPHYVQDWLNKETERYRREYDYFPNIHGKIVHRYGGERGGTVLVPNLSLRLHPNRRRESYLLIAPRDVVLYPGMPGGFQRQLMDILNQMRAKVECRRAMWTAKAEELLHRPTRIQKMPPHILILPDGNAKMLWRR